MSISPSLLATLIKVVCSSDLLAGDLIPRRVLCTGYCGGGAMATVAAVWMALQCPTADVRCITFGSPRVGNAAFCEAFKWVTAGALLLTACMPKLPQSYVDCLDNGDSGQPAHLTSPAKSLLPFPCVSCCQRCVSARAVVYA